MIGAAHHHGPPAQFGCDVAELRFIMNGREIRKNVHGLLVGRFFVRGRIDHEDWCVGVNGERSQARDWYVNHINTGFSWPFDALSVALFVADEMSRWSRVDPNTTDRSNIDKLSRQCGPDLWSWVESLPEDTLTVTPFRQWRDERSRGRS